MAFDKEIVFRIPAPSDGIETVLILFGIGAILVGVLAVLHHRETMARGFGWLKEHPWEKASAPVNLLSWVTLICVGPVAAVLFVLAVGEAFELLQQTGGSDSSVGSLGRGAVIVALIGAPFVIWRAVVAQKTVNVTEQGHITDRINTAVQGLGAEKTVKRQRKRQTGKLAYATGEDDTPDYSQPIMEEVTQPNLEVRIGAIYALERIAQDSDRDHVQIMEILCAYIRQNAPAPAKDDWPGLGIKPGEEDGPLEADWEERLGAVREEQESAKAALRVREDIQVALTVIGRRSAKQRRLEAGRGVERDFPFDVPCPDYDGPDDAHDRATLNAYRLRLNDWRKPLIEYGGYRLDLRNADMRGADLCGANLNGARLDETFLQGANLRQALLKGADLEKAHVQGADLQKSLLQGAELEQAKLQSAVLVEAQMQGANLWEARLQETELDGARLQAASLVMAQLQSAELNLAQLQGANLYGARFQGADLDQARLQGTKLDNARLQGANLDGGRLQGADLWGTQLDKDTNLSEATLRRAALRAVDCTDLPQIAPHLDGMFGDASVTLPDGHGPGYDDWPPHWPKFELRGKFQREWRKWQADPEGYRPPDPPEPEGAT